MTQLNILIMLRNLLPLLDEKGQDEILEMFEEEVNKDVLSKMKMKDVYEFSKLFPDIMMTDYFTREELVFKGYMTEEEKKQAEFETMYL